MHKCHIARGTWNSDHASYSTCVRSNTEIEEYVFARIYSLESLSTKALGFGVKSLWRKSDLIRCLNTDATIVDIRSELPIVHLSHTISQHFSFNKILIERKICAIHFYNTFPTTFWDIRCNLADKNNTFHNVQYFIQSSWTVSYIFRFISLVEHTGREKISEKLL